MDLSCFFCRKASPAESVRTLLINVTEAGSMREFTLCLNCASAITAALIDWIDAAAGGGQDKA
jgi:hypothetical protein